MKPLGECLRKSEWEVRPIDMTVGYELVRAYHYAKSGSNTATYMHGLFRRDDWMRCMGVAWWIPPTKGAAIATYDGDWRKVISLSRLVLSPDVPKNGASFLIGKSIGEIRSDRDWECLVTYADSLQGHTGAIYLATNWEYLGMTKPEATWVTADGVMVSRKTGSHTRTKSEMLDLGYTCVGKLPKHKFRKVIT